jgi:hypothetical protein
MFYIEDSSKWMALLERYKNVKELSSSLVGTGKFMLQNVPNIQTVQLQLYTHILHANILRAVHHTSM